MAKIQVCLIDDEKNIANFYQRMIKDKYYDLIDINTFYFANDLIAFSHNNKIDLLICDIDMPEKDGISLAKELRKSYADLEIIFLTGMNNFNNAYQALQISNVSYILKIDAEDFLNDMISKKIKNINERNTSYKKMSSIEENNYNLQDALISQTFSKVLNGDPIKTENFVPSLMFLLTLASGEGLKTSQKKDIAKLIRDSLSIKVGELLEFSSGKWVFLKTPVVDPKKLLADTEHLCKSIIEITNDFCLCVYTSKPSLAKDFHFTFENLIQYASKITDMDNIVHVECLADDNEELRVIEEDNQRLNDIKQYIWDHMETDVSLNSIANYLHYNPSYLSRLFKQKYQCNIKDFIIETKLKKAENLLTDTDLFVKEIASKLGFDSISHFFRIFKKVYGLAPNEYRANSQRNRKK